MHDVLIIGAGIGGIAAAARLAKLGYRVRVLEKTGAPGGRVALLKREGYTFDMGATLFLMPETYAQTYADLGERMEDHLDLRRVEPNYRVHFHDDTYLDITPNMVEMREQMEAMEPGSFRSLLHFMEEGYRHYYLSLEKFVGRNLYNAFDFFAPEHLPLLWKLKPLDKHINVISKHFKDARLRTAFSFQNMYLGLSPYDAPATYTLLPFTELAEGVWYPMGGLYRIVESLVDIAEGFGVEFHYHTSVKRIDVNGDRANGVTLENGETLRADIVIANADVPYVYADLLPENPMARRLHNKKYTSSAIMFYWAVRGDRSDALLHHNAFLADHKYKRSFEQIFNEYSMPEEPSFYVNAVTRTDPSMAPDGGDAIMVLVPVGCLDDKTPQHWDALRDRARSWVIGSLEKIGVQNLRERIRFEETLMPTDYRDVWNLARGTAFGLSHNVLQVGYLRPQNRHRQYGNLYFVGSSTHRGTGVPIVLMSAALVEKRIRKEHPAPARATAVTR